MADTIIDARQGDALCRACGLVRASHLLSSEAEYRTFQDEQGGKACNNKERVGPPSGMDTPPVSKIANAGLNKLNQLCGGRDNIPNVSPNFFKRTENLLIPQCVAADAVSMFRSMRPCMGNLTKQKLAALEAVCVYYACKGATQLKVPKTKEQVCLVFEVPMPLFWHINDSFTNASRGKPWYRLVTDIERAPDMLPTMLNRIGNDWTSRQRMEVTRKVTALYQQHHRHVKQLCIRGVLAAMLYMVCQDTVLPKQLTKAQLAAAAGITHTTVSNNIRLLEKKQLLGGGR